ncbi:MAG: 2-amino-4-hydroxy-6-hydroxymethyldihydropteridine diphosphokinase [Armatimonadia bacterium]|nr:2-amino-4-hydroxy-6-hydroxymethyldihydropteridine diphosphokinase [Armatimonadia bacterium]
MAYIGLGSNLGERLENLHQATRRLAESGGIRVSQTSSVYETRPWGVEDQPRFLNAAIEVLTELAPHDLLARCQEIEEALGRERTREWGPRVIDLDILLYGDRAVRTDDLTVPHPHLEQRAFVLVPLADVAPDLQLPSGRRVEQALADVGREGVRWVPGELM